MPVHSLNVGGFGRGSLMFRWMSRPSLGAVDALRRRAFLRSVKETGDGHAIALADRVRAGVLVREGARELLVHVIGRVRIGVGLERLEIRDRQDDGRRHGGDEPFGAVTELVVLLRGTGSVTVTLGRTRGIVNRLRPWRRSR